MARRVYKKRRVTRKVTKSAPKKFGYVKSQGNLLRDVKMLKSMVKKTKPEVKWLALGTPQSVLIGQSNVNASGVDGFYISMGMPAGVGNGNRIGEELKLIGMQLRMQFAQQSALTVGAHYIVDIIKFTDKSPTSLAGVIDKVYNTDTITGLIDTNSTLKNQYKKEYIRIFSKRVYLPADTQSSAANTLKDLKLFVKQNQRLEYEGTASSNPLNWLYCCIIRASTGNSSTTTASTLPLINNTAANTGAKISYTYKSFYTDV